VSEALPEPLARSRYAVELLAARPELAAELAADEPFRGKAMAAALSGADADDETALKRRLRRLRQRVLLRTMARDLSGAADLAEVCGAMSDLAEQAIACALGWAQARLAAEVGAPRGADGVEMPLLVVGMGKLGGRELNVSSDIDLVFVYPSEGESDAKRSISHHEYFTRLGKKLIALLDDVTEDGFVFRVDMRLRPYGESGPIAASLDALEAYFVAQGREWERYAWIKARAVTGNAAEREALAAVVRPFVFRKYLDYATLAAMRRLHGDVRREVARRELAEHVKLGPGGIREIEFIAQALQLVRGGRDPALSVRPTLEVLARLGERRLLPSVAVRELSDAYVFLRTLEHRLQYLDDAQTHTLPQRDEDRARVAALCGFNAWDAFAAKLAAVRDTVTRHFNAVFAENQPSAAGEFWRDDTEAVAERLAGKGFGNPPASAARLAALRASQRYAQLPEDSKRRIRTLIPELISAAAATPEPDATLARGLDLIEAIARRAAYLALLAENPHALERVAGMISASSWAAQFVTTHPLLLDELLDDRVLYAPPDWPAFARSLRARLADHVGDTERQMNELREQHQAQVFRLLAQDLAGLLTVEKLADHLSALADLALEAALELAWTQTRNRHRDDAPRFAVIGYGKLGGKELGYVSDLDIVFVFNDPHGEALEVYSRFAQRFNNWLNSRTSSGVLFETDLRLRPSGDAGLLVSSLEAFERYQENDAWTWEHQALTRARYCAGDRQVGDAFEALRERILRRPRNAAKLARDVLEMREKMHKGHPNRSGLFDVKHGRGGMVDVEFVVQFLVLAYSQAQPKLTGNLGNIALLAMAAELGLCPEDLAKGAREAYREFRRIQHTLRLKGAQYARVPGEQIEVHAQVVRALWNAVFAEYS
jgi:[glutamine synthetase] adenylyltransferase / [glutamine synthetase]-adenylyl-L-tyrosine phosphorylase